MDAGQIIALVAASGFGGIITKLIDSATARRQEQRAERKELQDERDRIVAERDQALEQRNLARDERDRALVARDKESRARRLLEEYAHALRALLNRLGASEGDGADDFRSWPEY